MYIILNKRTINYRQEDIMEAEYKNFILNTFDQCNPEQVRCPHSRDQYLTQKRYYHGGLEKFPSSKYIATNFKVHIYITLIYLAVSYSSKTLLFRKAEEIRLKAVKKEIIRKN